MAGEVLVAGESLVVMEAFLAGGGAHVGSKCHSVEPFWFY